MQTLLIVYNNLGIGGITKSLIDALRVIDYSKYEVTLYIRRDDILDCIDQIPKQVQIRLIENEVKKQIFEQNIVGHIARFVHKCLNRRHKYLAKQFFLKYKYPLQRKRESFDMKDVEYDIAISYSTDGDDPVFTNKCVNAKRKYIFLHQSTKIAKMNIKAMKSYDKVISVNPLLEPWIKKMTKSSNNVCTIENYVDYEEVRYKAKDVIEIPKNKYIFSTCGRLCKTKGFDYVVHTAEILKNNGIEFVWYWIGDGAERMSMETIIKEKGLQNEVIITGMKNNPYPYINACDIYIQPSRAEAYGLTILEALILKKVVVTTYTKGGEYIIKKYNCGILVDENPKTIASEILSLLENRDKYEEHKKKVTNINWEAENKRYKEDWKNLLEGTYGMH